MSIRRDPIYISYDVWRALWLISKSKEQSPDEVADDILREVITVRYPQLFKHQKELEKLEKILIESLTNEKQKQA